MPFDDQETKRRIEVLKMEFVSKLEDQLNYKGDKRRNAWWTPIRGHAERLLQALEEVGIIKGNLISELNLLIGFIIEEVKGSVDRAVEDGPSLTEMKIQIGDMRLTNVITYLKAL